MRGLIYFGILAFAVVFATSAEAERRVALVIGNDRYEHLEKLQKAVADAQSYADVLRAKGFDQVTLEHDLTRGRLDEAIATFLDQIEPGDTAVFAYSGHGWSDGIQNYIVGTDAPAKGSQDLLARISIPLKNGLNGIIDEMDRKGARLKVAVIDACRDNPFTPLLGKKSIGLGRGMTRIDPPHGTFVVFSAGAGQSALDRLWDGDPDPNSVFTRVFVPAIRADVTLQEAIKTTQERVVALARSIKQDQNPAYYDEVIGSACLSGKCIPGGAAGVTDRPADTAFSQAQAAYEAAVRIGSKAAYQSIIDSFPNTVQAKLAAAAAAVMPAKEVASVTPPTAALEPAPPPARAPTPACDGGLVASVGDAGVAAAVKRCLKPKDGFRDCTDCPEMVVIPAGTFTMGSPKNEKDRRTDEGPQHDVTIAKPFAMGKFEVTVGEYAAFVKASGHGSGTSCYVSNGSELKDTKGRSWRDPGIKQTDLHPVACVSWEDAAAYIAWLAKESGRDYRLLSEAEWEYAARGETRPGDYPRFYFGSDEVDLCHHANGADKTTSLDGRNKSCSDGVGAATASAGSYKANAFGLYDMLGNVWEWTEDCHHDSYAGAPNDGSVWTSASCQNRVLRGGAWNSEPRFLRAGLRSGLSPDMRFLSVGFRVARTL